MYSEEVPITNFSEKANLHRNSNRWIVDEKLANRDRLIAQLELFDENHPHAIRLKEKIEQLTYEAHQIWRQIVTEANVMVGDFRNKLKLY